jgi:hypothetical protein
VTRGVYGLGSVSSISLHSPCAQHGETGGRREGGERVEGRLKGTCVNSDLWSGYMCLIVGVREEGMGHVFHHTQARTGTAGIDATHGTYTCTRRMHSEKRMIPQSHARAGKHKEPETRNTKLLHKPLARVRGQRQEDWFSDV